MKKILVLFLLIFAFILNVKKVNALTYEEAIKYIGNKVDLVIPSYGCEAKGMASTVVGFKDDDIVVYRQGEVKI